MGLFCPAERHSKPHAEGSSSPVPCAHQSEGLLHDARNLVGAIGLYCDLLSMPHVLRSEHRHYADELRLLGERAAALMERLIDWDPRTVGRPGFGGRAHSDRRSPAAAAPGETDLRPAEGLRSMVERCAGLVRGVAQGCPVSFSFGEAAALSVGVPAESVERILINLVRNGAAAMAGRLGAVRVDVGLPPGACGEARPWPFQRVALSVEDSGCGMAPGEVEYLLADSVPYAFRPPVHHGIGFRVVRELVQASAGELSIQSEPGRGTRIQIEWPVAQLEPHPGNRAGDAAEQNERWRRA